MEEDEISVTTMTIKDKTETADDEDAEFVKEPSATGDKSVTISKAASIAPSAAGNKSVTLSKPASASSSRLKKSRSRKKNPKAAKKCAAPAKWDCEEEALWRIYMRT